MMLRNLLFACLLLFVPALASAQEVEVHSVGVYEGNIRTDGRIHGGQVRIAVDRRERPVILSIGSYEPLRWFITTTPGTKIETILLHGYQPERSEVYLNDVPVTPRILDGVGYAYKNQGNKFRQIVETLAEETGMSTLASFHGSYKAPAEPFVINRVALQPENRVEHLQDRVDADRVPPELRPYLDPNHSGATVGQVSFGYEGFTLNTEDGAMAFAPTLDVPDISHPTGAAYDAEGQRLFGVTFGGEGFLYQYDIEADQWSILTSMRQNDAVSMIYDPVADRIIFGMGVVSSGLMVFDFETRALRAIPLNLRKTPGFSDLYDPGNGPPPDSVPIAVSGNWLLLRAGGSRVFRETGGASRTYLVDMRTGEATLVAYTEQQ